MKKLFAMAIAASVAYAPIIASADQEQELNELRERVQSLEDLSVEESRHSGNSASNQQYFGLGSGVYNEQLYIHDFGLNKDLNLLHQRGFLDAQGISLKEAPRVMMSGFVFARAGHHSNVLPVDGSQHKSFIEGEIGMDFTGFVNDMWLAYFQIEAQGFGGDQGVVVDQGFTTFGNLDKFPVYATAGYFYPAFGDYTTQYISDSLPQELGRIRAPAIAVGYDKVVEDDWEISASAFIYDGDSKTSDDFRLDEVGANFQVHKEGFGPQNNMELNLGASVVNNMASSLGIRSEAEGLPGSKLSHYVPAYDVRGKYGMGNFYVQIEYLSAIRHFAKDDFTQTRAGHSADAIKPTALHTEAVYGFDIWGIPSMVAVTYQYMEDTLAFDLPKEMYGPLFQISPFRNTKLTVEYLQKKDYGSNTTTSNGMTGSGKTDDLVQAEISVFF